MKTSLLRDVTGRSAGSGLVVAWGRAGRGRVTVRALRSDQWYPQAPDDHGDGSWGARLVYEGHGSGFADAAPPADDVVYYSLFSRRGSEPWRLPVTLCVSAGRQEGSVRAEVHGSRAAVRAEDVDRELLTVLYPAAFSALLLVALVTSGLVERCTLAAAWALLPLWRRHAGRELDEEAFAAWLLVPLGIAGVAALAKVTMAFLLPPDQAFVGRGDILWTVLTLAGTAGAWRLAGRALAATRPAAKLLLVAPAVLALLWPHEAAVVLAACLVADAVARALGRRRS